MSDQEHVKIEVLEHDDQQFSLRFSSTGELEPEALRAIAEWLTGSDPVRFCTIEPDGGAVRLHGEFMNGYRHSLDAYFMPQLKWRTELQFSPASVEIHHPT